QQSGPDYGQGGGYQQAGSGYGQGGGYQQSGSGYGRSGAYQQSGYGQGRQSGYGNEGGGYPYGSQGRPGQDRGFASRRGLGPRNYTRTDERIREDVNERLMDDDHVD